MPVPRPSIWRHAAGVAFALLVVVGLIASLLLVSPPRWKPLPPNPPSMRPLIEDPGMTSSAFPTALLTLATVPRSIVIHTGRGDVRIDCQTGLVAYPPGVDLDDATRLFWQAMARTR